MYHLYSTFNATKKLVASFETKDAAFESIGMHNIVFHEEDIDHPGCWDMFLKNGEIYALEIEH